MIVNPFFFFRHSRAYLHALFKSDTAAMHHITIHNISYQVIINQADRCITRCLDTVCFITAGRLISSCPRQLTLMRSVRQSIIDQRFPEFVKAFMKRMFPSSEQYPSWAVEALQSVNITVS